MAGDGVFQTDNAALSRLLFLRKALEHGLGFYGSATQAFLPTGGAGANQVTFAVNRLPDHATPVLQCIFFAAFKLDKSRPRVNVLTRRVWPDFKTFQVIFQFCSLLGKKSYL